MDLIHVQAHFEEGKEKEKALKKLKKKFEHEVDPTVRERWFDITLYVNDTVKPLTKIQKLLEGIEVTEGYADLYRNVASVSLENAGKSESRGGPAQG